MKNSPESLTHNANLDTMYRIGNSINGPITSAMDISSCPGKEFIAIANANGELRASVVIVRLAYSAYVKWIFSDKSKSIMAFAPKKIIRGRKIVIIELRLANKSSPWLANMQKTASDKSQICDFENNSVTFSAWVLLIINLVSWDAMKGITITINIE